MSQPPRVTTTGGTPVTDVQNIPTPGVPGTSLIRTVIFQEGPWR
jgi:hypothetical protein